MPPAQDITDFYALIRDHWGELTAFRAGARTAMLNFGHWPEGTASLHEAQQAFLARITDALPAAATAARGLEIGCGIGGISLGVLQRLPQARLVGLDISPQQLALARAHADAGGVGARFDAVQADAMALPFADGCFDFSLCIESSFHYPDKTRFVAEAARTLRPGGRLVLADITCDDVSRVQFRQGNFFDSPTRYLGWLEAAGLRVVHAEDLGPHVYGPLLQHVRAHNETRRSRVGRYWSLVLANYEQLQREGAMGYWLFVVDRPEAPARRA